MLLLPIIILIVFVTSVDLSGFNLNGKLTTLLYVSDEETAQPSVAAVSNTIAPEKTSESVGESFATHEDVLAAIGEIYTKESHNG